MDIPIFTYKQSALKTQTIEKRETGSERYIEVVGSTCQGAKTVPEHEIGLVVHKVAGAGELLESNAHSTDKAANIIRAAFYADSHIIVLGVGCSEADKAKRDNCNNFLHNNDFFIDILIFYLSAGIIIS